MEINGDEAFKRHAFREFAQLSDLLLFETEEMKTFFGERFPGLLHKARVHTTPGVDLGVFFPRDQMISRTQLGLPLDRKIILHVSGFQRHHDFDTIERAFRKTAEGEPELLLVLLGSGPRLYEISENLRDLIDAGLVLMPGAVAPQQVAAYIGCADVCLSVSIPEVLDQGNLRSFKIYEYSACQRPVVEAASERVALPKWASESLVIVPPASPVRVSEALLSVLRSPGVSSDRAAKARAYVVNNRSWPAVSRSTIEAIHEIMTLRKLQRT